ncbi:50S ribosomal protein L11 methyltransferase [Echinimonas agarilytica]|uniref:Ribosomal protein L11 methyltransferase n=1 Tax=Echinimonas agarilytica TaxID=1215918 RepID=A0AA41W4L1_9GAMM|nr:50S ribosomal protein L11 methyltransferase [Echinimonas agarilytica]MCM2678403.1 50S ribosomal protein L11 methyltransferase [Echinimonas agarilytica]
MAWIQLRINATADTAESIGDAMMECGALSITFLDSKDVPIFEPLPGETRLWGETDVMGLWTADVDTDIALTYLKGLFGEFRYKLEALEDKDWEREWMDNFHPMKFGQRLWICPSWCDIPEPDAVNVMLDPGLAFGTGTHPTTALCLEWLESLDLQGKTVIDYGCGSGILGVAALKLGAARVIGVDIDPQAIEASQVNAERNGVAGQIELYLAGEAELPKADVLVANILAGPLTELAPSITELIQPNGKLALSGLLAEQQDHVAAAYQSSFHDFGFQEQEQWMRINASKNG